MKNNAVLDTADDLETAYQRIEDELGIPVIELGYIPEGMKFKQLMIENNNAIIQFEYNGKSVYLREEKYPTSKEVFHLKVSDRKEFMKIYSKWIDESIAVEKNILQDGLVEYSAGINHENEGYYLSGIVDEKVFIKMVDWLLFR